MLISKEEFEEKLQDKDEKILFHILAEETMADLYALLAKRAYMDENYEFIVPDMEIGAIYEIDTVNRVTKPHVGQLSNKEVYHGFTDEESMQAFERHHKLNKIEKNAQDFLSNASSKIKFYCFDSEESIVLFKILRSLGYRWANEELLNNPDFFITYFIDPEERKVRYTKNGIQDDSVMTFSNFESTNTTDNSDKEDEIHISYDKRLECLFIKTAKDVICVPVVPQLLEHVSITKNMDSKTAEELESFAYYHSLLGGTSENSVFNNTKPGNKIQQKEE